MNGRNGFSLWQIVNRHFKNYLATIHASMSTAETRGLSIKWRDSVPGEVLLVKMMLLSGLGAHITNKSLEKPHSMSGTLTKTA